MSTCLIAADGESFSALWALMIGPCLGVAPLPNRSCTGRCVPLAEAWWAAVVPVAGHAMLDLTAAVVMHPDVVVSYEVECPAVRG